MFPQRYYKLNLVFVFVILFINFPNMGLACANAVESLSDSFRKHQKKQLHNKHEKKETYG